MRQRRSALYRAFIPELGFAMAMVFVGSPGLLAQGAGPSSGIPTCQQPTIPIPFTMGGCPGYVKVEYVVVNGPAKLG